MLHFFFRPYDLAIPQEGQLIFPENQQTIPKMEKQIVQKKKRVF